MNKNTSDNLFSEGGNMKFKSSSGELLEVSPIHQDNVAATLDDVQERFISEQLHLDPSSDTSPIGSTGKKLSGQTSSDLDIAIDYNRLKEEWDLPEWTGRRLEEWVDLAQDAAEKCGVEFAMAATVCSLRWPIVNEDGEQEGEYVQVDLMPTPNMKMMAFGRFSQQARDGETFFKGTVRNIMLSIMARCSYHKDLTDDTHIKVLDDGTEKEVHNEYEGWTYDGNSGLHLCHKRYERYTRNGAGFRKGDWKPHASVVDSPVISSDPDEIVEMIFGKGVRPEDIDTVQKMWRAWKSSPAVKENPDLIDEVKTQVQKSASNSPDIQFPDFDGEEFVNESDEPADSKQRVAVIITDGKDAIVGKSPQNRFKQFSCCDLMKGHAHIGEGLEDAAKREVQEECGLRITNLKRISSELKYSKGTTLTFFVSRMEPLPDPNSLECQSFFERDGKKFPEIAEYLKVPVEELPVYLYKGLASLIVGNNLLAEVMDGSTVNEARAKKDPRQQVKEYLDSLPDDLVEKLNTRCAELLDKWGVEVDDTPIELMSHEMGDDRFLKFLKKTVPLTEPKPRDMGANTFVSHFFDPPFDIEAFIGKMAKEKGIPFTQAEEEWSRSNLDKTHVGRYAHMLADDAVNGRPPSKEGTNPKEIAIYTAIYDYARNLVSDATDVESEVSLHADSAYVGGKFDLLMKKNGIWTLVDWKTNGEELDDIPTGKVGLDDLTKNINNNSYNKYALQLNVYEWAAKDSGKIPKDAKVSKELHHFQYLEDGKPVKIRVVKVPDLQELVQAMVNRAVELGVVKSKI